MSRIFIPLVAAAFLAGCDGENPFQIEAVSDDGDTELVDANDPNTDVNSQFAYDPTRNLTMNSVEYDQTNDRLIINNIPFDGPDGVYDDVAGQRTVNANGQVTDIFQNTESVINGELQYYAVFVQSDFLDATSAAGQDWRNFGFAGANLNRTEYQTPTVPEGTYAFVGVYAATRTYAERAGIELIRGDTELFLDVGDVDELDGQQGTVYGRILNRTRNPIADSMVGDLPNVSLISVTFNTETGVWEDGIAETYKDDLTVRDRGIHDGLIAGPDADELGGYVIFEGVADIQTVSFEVVDWEIVSGGVVIESGQTTGLQLADAEDLQAQVNAGDSVGLLTVGVGDIPTGAVVTSTTTETVDIETDYDAREIGVFVTDRD